jgi:phospholipid/cholesterol/gamma-HCH transport system permease protein
MQRTVSTWIAGWLQGLGAVALLAREAFQAVLKSPTPWKETLYQIYFVGVKSQSVVLITGAFTGMVLSAQTYFQFHKVKMDTATLAVTGVSMCSELGPVLTGLMVAGRVGAAIAAELGSMRVTEQVDALRTLATHPVDYLVVPRLLSLHVAMPLLTLEAVAVGIGAGYAVCVWLLGIDPAYLWHNMLTYTDVPDLLTGLLKSIVFGGVIALVGCYKGLCCGEGAEGVGRATTEAVVYASITILITNFFMTMALGPLLSAL